MARIARVVAAGIAYHITQRGNRRQETFFCAEDYQAYMVLMGEWCRASEVEVWTSCLMLNHVHLIAVPTSEDGFRRAIGEAHRRYTRRANFREGWRGHLWQGPFAAMNGPGAPWGATDSSQWLRGNCVGCSGAESRGPNGAGLRR